MTHSPKEEKKVLFTDIFPPKEETLVIGAGEIGKSVKEVLDSAYTVFIRDVDEPKELKGKTFRVINICYPYFPKFVEVTKKYAEQYKAEIVIVHSTVKPGTVRQLGEHAVHSPVNGKHPNLAKSILTFVKFIGGTNVFIIFNVVEYFVRAGIKPFVFSSPEATELAKVLCTTQYGWYLMVMKEVARVCNEFNVPFHEVYTEWNNAYNAGYAAMGMKQFTRPILFPMDGSIGGHCVIPNCELLDDYLTKTLKGRNETYKSPQKISEASTPRLVEKKKDRKGRKS